MRRQGLLWLNAALSVIPASLFAGAAVEGRVELPKSRSAPVQAKRYEIVTKAGVLSTQPPLAVIYLDGNFPRPASLPTKEVEQKDLTFIPALLPIEVGTRVQFPNLDDTYHNIFSYSPKAADLSNSGTIWLGCRLGIDDVRNERFRGEVDELFIADRALEQQEIVRLMNNNRLEQ